MIKLIGLKRGLILLALLAINVILLSIYMFGIEPMRMESEQQRDGVRAEIADFQGKIQNIKQEVITFNENLPKYNTMKDRGFFLPQDRFQMGRDLDAARAASRVKGFNYDISDIRTIPSIEATNAQMRLVNSRFELKNIDLLTDDDFFLFVDMMDQKFPQQLRLQSFTMRRTGELTADTLKNLATTGKAGILEVNATFDWFTLVPIPKTPDPATAGMPGGAQ